ncbi:MAG: acyl-CoA dehydrogenase family protein [Proteobacteria bacterium]|nr:acyl-CoA dehydrogenase family protein [Pseudomonadota bacterium]
MSAAEERDESLRMIRDSAAAVAPRGGDLKRIRDLRFTEPGFDRAVWQQMAEMGWVGLRLSEDAGGSGLGMAALCALAEELGQGLVPEPLIPVAMAARLLPSDRLGPVLAGERIVLPAWQEQPNSLETVGATALSGGRLSGRKVFVPMAAGADAFLVTVPGGLALVERGAPGVSVATEQTQDGGHFGTITFDNAPAEALPSDALPCDAAEALDEAALATSAYLLGAMDRAFAMTLEYLKTRQQFGRLIGSFQALQHRAVDLQIQVALTRASVEAAAATLDAGASPALRQAVVSRAKARASEAAMTVTKQAIQLHGGIGYTDAYDVGLFLRKAMVLGSLFGPAALHRARFDAVSPEDEEE